MTAVVRDTPSQPLGPWVLPGQYTVQLTVAGKSYKQQLTVKMDPRVNTAPEGLVQQFDLSMQCYEGLKRGRESMAQIRKLRTQIKDLQGKVSDKALADALAEVDRKAAALEGTARGRGQRLAAEPREPTFGRASGELLNLLGVLQAADVVPTSQVVAACAEVQKSLTELLSGWTNIREKEVKALNERLREAKLSTIPQ
jgi:hypothetical protein